MSRIRTQLCAGCADKLGKLYRLTEVPGEYSHAGYGKCGLCSFRGELSEFIYDPERDKIEKALKKQEEIKQGCTFSPSIFDDLKIMGEKLKECEDA